MRDLKINLCMQLLESLPARSNLGFLWRWGPTTFVDAWATDSGGRPF